MGIDLEVKALSRAGHGERSEPRSVDSRGRREGNGERSCGPTNRNQIRGGADQGERATKDVQFFNIDTLNGKVTSLETKVQNLNTEIKALKATKRVN